MNGHLIPALFVAALAVTRVLVRRRRRFPREAVRASGRVKEVLTRTRPHDPVDCPLP